MCRNMMQQIMSKYHPSLWESYISGKVKDVPRFENDHLTSYKRKPIQPRVDARVDVSEKGGSLNKISHSENGFLISHNAEFHNYVEVV